jgi:hypothetical protein
VLGLIALDRGECKDAIRHCELAESFADSCGAETQVLHARVVRAAALRISGQVVAGRQAIEEVMPRATVLADRSILARLHCGLALSRAWTGPAPLARRHCEEALACLGEGGDRRSHGWPTGR